MNTTFCIVCCKITSNYCAKCKLVGYCSTECQREDWSRHKQCCIKRRNNAVRYADLVNHMVICITLGRGVAKLIDKARRKSAHKGFITAIIGLEILESYYKGVNPTTSKDDPIKMNFVTQDFPDDIIRSYPTIHNEVGNYDQDTEIIVCYTTKIENDSPDFEGRSTFIIYKHIILSYNVFDLNTELESTYKRL